MSRHMRCPAVGAMTVGGREVAVFQCELDDGHIGRLGDLILGPTPHRYLLEWADDDRLMLPDADLFDPDEALVDPTR